MTKRQARLFAYISSIGFALVFIALTIHSHTRFGELTNAENITPQIVEGKHVWHRNNCINCHTLLGEGAYYAPDLTKITQQRGEAYLTAFLQDPSQFYSHEKHRRVMPNPKLSAQEIADVIAFLDWVSHIDTGGWPPRPIHVSGGTLPGTADLASARGQDAAGSELAAPSARGEELFRSAIGACSACHSTTPGTDGAGPSLAGIVGRADEVVVSDNYHGEATDAASYIREAIEKPSAHLAPGPRYSANGMSLMPNNYGQKLSTEQIDSLVDYLLTLK